MRDGTTDDAMPSPAYPDDGYLHRTESDTCDLITTLPHDTEAAGDPFKGRNHLMVRDQGHGCCPCPSSIASPYQR
jgi:hypothetical protein